MAAYYVASDSNPGDQSPPPQLHYFDFTPGKVSHETWQECALHQCSTHDASTSYWYYMYIALLSHCMMLAVQPSWSSLEATLTMEKTLEALQPTSSPAPEAVVISLAESLPASCEVHTPWTAEMPKQDSEASGRLNVLIHFLWSFCRRGTNSCLAAFAVPPQLFGQCLQFLLVTICSVYAQYIYINIVGSSMAANGLMHITGLAIDAATKFRKSTKMVAWLCISRAYLGMSCAAWSGRRCLLAQALFGKNIVKYCALQSTTLRDIVKWFLTILCAITVCICLKPKAGQFLYDLVEILAYPGFFFWIYIVIVIFSTYYFVIASKPHADDWKSRLMTRKNAIRPRTWNQRRQ